MNKISIAPNSVRLMGIDPVATGCQLKKYRKAHQLTQDDLSSILDQCWDPASRVIISAWENGRKLPSLSHLVHLSELYGCSLDELVMSYRRSTSADDSDRPVPLMIEYLLLFNKRLKRKNRLIFDSQPVFSLLSARLVTTYELFCF